MIMDFADALSGEYTPDELRHKWDKGSLNEIIAIRSIRSLERDELDNSEDSKKRRAESRRTIDRLHKRLLDQLNTETVADRINPEARTEKSNLKEAIRQHNQNLPKNKLN